jgi:hypothetical protein
MYDHTNSNSHRANRFSPLLWWGLGVLTIGVGPLMLFIFSDAIGFTKDSNPIGPGLLAFFTFWPGVGLTVAGAILTLKRRRA